MGQQRTHWYSTQLTLLSAGFYFGVNLPLEPSGHCGCYPRRCCSNAAEGRTAQSLGQNNRSPSAPAKSCREMEKQAINRLNNWLEETANNRRGRSSAGWVRVGPLGWRLTVFSTTNFKYGGSKHFNHGCRFLSHHRLFMLSFQKPPSERLASSRPTLDLGGLGTVTAEEDGAKALNQQIQQLQ